jgi:hypothetical protein
MQVKNKNGNYGPMVPFDQEKMETFFDNPETESVEVFKASEAQITKHNKYSVGKRFKKVPSNKNYSVNNEQIYKRNLKTAEELIEKNLKPKNHK